MNTIKHLLLTTLMGLLCIACEVHDAVDITVKHKAAVYLKYHYDNGKINTLNDIRTMRLFIFDEEGRLYRDTLLSMPTVVEDGPAMQTYLTRGRYTFVSWANVSESTTVEERQLESAVLGLHPAGADQLLYGRFETPIVKGDSLRFDIDLFKSVFKINVRVRGLEKVPYPEKHYFAIENREALDFFNRPSGELKHYRPELAYENGCLSGSFYTPWFTDNDDLTIGIYCDHPDAPDYRLCETTIRDFASIVNESIGHDVEIDVEISIVDTGISIIISDWRGVIVQQEQLGE